MLVSEGGEKRRVLLRRLRSVSGGYSSLNLVDHDVKLRKSKLPYVVLLATNNFPNHGFIASPAVSGGSMYLRSHSTLFCVRR